MADWLDQFTGSTGAKATDEERKQKDWLDQFTGPSITPPEPVETVEIEEETKGFVGEVMDKIFEFGAQANPDRGPLRSVDALNVAQDNVPDRGPSTGVANLNTYQNTADQFVPDQGPRTSVESLNSTDEFEDESIWGKAKGYVSDFGNFISAGIGQFFGKPEDFSVTRGITEAVRPGGLGPLDFFIGGVPIEGKLEATKGLTKGLAEGVVSTVRTGAEISPLNIFPSYREGKESRQKAYELVDTQVNKIRPSEGYEEIFKIGEFAGEVAPYIAGEAGVVKAVGALPKALQGKKWVKGLGSVAEWVGIGQILHRPEDGSRVDRALLDLAGLGVFKGAGLTLKGAGKLFQKLDKAEVDNVVKALDDTSQQIYKKIENGDNVIIDEVEYLVKDMKANRVAGTTALDNIKVNTNSLANIDNFTPNFYKTDFQINPKVKDVEFNFSDDRLRVVAPDAQSLAEVAGKVGQEFNVKANRLLDDAFEMRLDDYANRQQTIKRALTEMAVAKKSRNATPDVIIKEVENSVKKIDEQLNELAKGLVKKGETIDTTRVQREALEQAIEQPEKLNKSRYQELLAFTRGLRKAEGRPVAPVAVEEVAEVVTKPEVKAPVKKKPKKVAVPKEQLPVGEGKVKKSKLEARIKESLADVEPDQIKEIGGDATFKQMNKKEQIDKAIDYVTKNPEDALAVLRGEKTPPEGLLENSIFVAMNNASIGNVELARKLASLASTRAGQNISILTEVSPNSPVKFITQLERRKAAQVAEEGYEVVKKREYKRAENAIRKSAPKKDEWGAFLEEIKC